MASSNRPTLSLLILLTLTLLSLSSSSSSSCSSSSSSALQQSDPIWIKPYIIDYQNGTVVRDTITEPPSTVDPPQTSQVNSKDITIAAATTRHPLRARVFLPARPDPNKKLPVIVYFHGGAFCIGSPFSPKDTLYLTRVSGRARVIALSLDYTLFPDGVIPAPYDDAWAFLNWVAAHKTPGPGSDPWLARFGDLDRLFIGGDSAGGNIAHNIAIRAGMTRLPWSVKLTGAFLAMPYFLGPESLTGSPNFKVWAYVCPGCKGGANDPVINPGGPGAPSLRRLGCERMVVYAAELDEFHGRDVLYYKRVKKSGWAGRIQMIVAKGKQHVFHIEYPDDPATAKLIHDLAEFLNYNSTKNHSTFSSAVDRELI